MVVVFGASGHAKEILYILRKSDAIYAFPAFLIAESDSNNRMNIPILSEDDFLDKMETNVFNSIIAYVAIGNNRIRNKIVEKFTQFDNLKFPNLITNNVEGDFDNISLGNGNLFFPSSQLTTDIKIGNHNHFNSFVNISHDCIIGNYNTFSPGVLIAGNVTIGNNNFFGLGSKIIDKITICDNVKIGAGAVVVNDILNPGTYIGVPALKIK